jgi:hypothetical protein
LLEGAGDGLGSHARPGVGHPDDEVGPLPVSEDRHRPGRAELHGVGGQVEQHLAQPPGIGADDVRDRGLDTGDERQGLGLGDRTDHPGDVLDQLADARVLDAQLQPTGVGAGEVQQVIKHGGHGRGRAVHALDQLPGPVVQRLLQEDVDQADDPDDGSADVVADGGQELTAGVGLRLRHAPSGVRHGDIAIDPRGLAASLVDGDHEEVAFEHSPVGQLDPVPDDGLAGSEKFVDTGQEAIEVAPEWSKLDGGSLTVGTDEGGGRGRDAEHVTERLVGL